MISFDNIPKIFIASGSTDLRKGIDGYALIIQDVYKLSPFEDVLFIFCNRHHNKIKCLYWDGTGFWLLYKRLDKGHFKWEKKNGLIEISHQQLGWLLQGLKIMQKNYLEPSFPRYI